MELSYRVPSNPLLRPARRDDADAIAALHAASWRATYKGIFRQEFLDHEAAENRNKLWHARLDDPAPNQWVQLADVENGLAGFICVFAKEDDEWGSLIDNLHVAPGLGRQGIGRALMGSAAQWLSQSFGDSPVHLWVLDRNDSARQFYEKLGGRNVGAEEHEHADGQMLPAYRYVWPHPGAIGA